MKKRKISADSYTLHTSENELLKKAKGCNCRKTNCLKFYCECFSMGELCNPEFCKCLTCSNNKNNLNIRSKAIESAIGKNNNAFLPKFSCNTKKSNNFKGCNCKKSGCLKKYCECFTNNSTCSKMCKCEQCKNNDELKNIIINY